MRKLVFKQNQIFCDKILLVLQKSERYDKTKLDLFIGRTQTEKKDWIELNFGVGEEEQECYLIPDREPNDKNGNGYELLILLFNNGNKLWGFRFTIIKAAHKFETSPPTKRAYAKEGNFDLIIRKNSRELEFQQTTLRNAKTVNPLHAFDFTINRNDPTQVEILNSPPPHTMLEDQYQSGQSENSDEPIPILPDFGQNSNLPNTNSSLVRIEQLQLGQIESPHYESYNPSLPNSPLYHEEIQG